MIMLIIRNEQMNAFREQSLTDFRARAEQEIRSVWLEICSVIGNDAVSASIDMAIERSRHYHLTTEFCTMRYLHLMYRLGFDFDMDDTLPWAGRILNDDLMSDGDRVRLLEMNGEMVSPKI
ncbi:MAG: hypothetical protein ABIQ57_04760 [Candidatus Kapaibacterium sp.]